MPAPARLFDLSQVPLAGLMLTVAAGYALGRIRLCGVAAGPAAGTLAVAVMLGQLGLSLDWLYGAGDPTLTIGRLGFALFIYSVGFEAGPRFFASLRSRSGWQFVGVGALVNVLAVAVAVVVGRLLALDGATTAGMLAGALTSAPTYAAASEVVADTARLSLSFAVTYPFGLVGLVLLLQALPRLMRERLSDGLASEDELDHEEARPALARDARTPEITRVFRATHQGVLGRPLKELDLIRRTGCLIARVRRGDTAGDTAFVPDADTELAAGDTVLVVGRLDELEKFEELVGPETYDIVLLHQQPPSRHIRVDNPEVFGKTLAGLGLHRFRCLVTRVERGGEFLEPDPDLRLERDDIVELSGERDGVRAAAAVVGRLLPRVAETNIAAYAGGILAGLLLGAIHIRPFGLDLTLGAAGGLLLAGLVLGRFRRFGRRMLSVPRPARQLVRDLGILLFVAETGIRTGAELRAGADFPLWKSFAGGLLVTLVPVIVSLIVARRLLRLRPVDAWGSVCGGMTSSAALQAVKHAADSSEPAISYAAAYAVAAVLVTMAGHVVVLLM